MKVWDLRKMELYIGTQILKARPQRKVTKTFEDGQKMVEYWDGIKEPLREGMEIPPGITDEDGYEVEYQDGYRKWIPKEVFDEAYRRADLMSFGAALEAAKKGRRIRRADWYGKTYVCLSDGFRYMDGENIPIRKAFCLIMETEVIVGWLPIAEDMLAEDWVFAD